MLPSKEDIVHVYRKRAKRYDVSANLYQAIGFREPAYRRRAVAALQLHEGAQVVELGCGTGLNFPLLQQAVGPRGRIIGMDLNDAMLDQARRRVERNDWRNVELVQADVAEYEIPPKLDGILTTFALTLSPQYDAVIARAAKALSPGRRFVILDLKLSDKYPMWLVKLAVLITKPFGVTLEMGQRHPWESVRRYFAKTTYDELYGGFAYICVGQVAG